MCRVLCLLVVLAGEAAAGGGQAVLSPLWQHSVRSVLLFSPNTQSLRLLYRGKLSVLMFRSPWRYSDVGLPGPANGDTPRLGTGLEWHSSFTSSVNELRGVTQLADGRRTRTLLERCRG